MFGSGQSVRWRTPASDTLDKIVIIQIDKKRFRKPYTVRQAREVDYVARYRTGIESRNRPGRGHGPPCRAVTRAAAEALAEIRRRRAGAGGGHGRVAHGPGVRHAGGRRGRRDDRARAHRRLPGLPAGARDGGAAARGAAGRGAGRAGGLGRGAGRRAGPSRRRAGAPDQPAARTGRDVARGRYRRPAGRHQRPAPDPAAVPDDRGRTDCRGQLQSSEGRPRTGHPPPAPGPGLRIRRQRQELRGRGRLLHPPPGPAARRPGQGPRRRPGPGPRHRPHGRAPAPHPGGGRGQPDIADPARARGRTADQFHPATRPDAEGRRPDRPDRQPGRMAPGRRHRRILPGPRRGGRTRHRPYRRPRRALHRRPRPSADHQRPVPRRTDVRHAPLEGGDHQRPAPGGKRGMPPDAGPDPPGADRPQRRVDGRQRRQLGLRRLGRRPPRDAPPHHRGRPQPRTGRNHLRPAGRRSHRHIRHHALSRFHPASDP
ncbi:putative secretion protein, HlyD-family [Gluconacetobacter diazotrophicus PA1 5]|uniref:Putative secretion protein, HlyD-family n=1 Tax=Gluconacetobacter diazotrophicus (strain ATCC 49037 / DSM 5601 / CCUG 37298 / CIP 103539 / LMG 7603 / PAl5) TaxID=272568 RepID=A9H7P2_GLUDA|nr:putative secretion protein, HlyD-family [Gluconacetobacter diazotrophicus PA1 5]